MDSLITAGGRALAPLPTGHDTWGPSNPTPGGKRCACFVSGTFLPILPGTPTFSCVFPTGRANESPAEAGAPRTTFTIGVSEDDLRVIAERSYERAESADHDQHGLFRVCAGKW
jgi:hypothetical protein